MRKLFTLRRLAGLALGLGGLVLLATGGSTGQPMLSWAGLILWGVLGFGLAAALIQRVVVVMHLAAATRADVGRALSLQENLPALVRKSLAEQAGVQRAELSAQLLQLRQELAREMDAAARMQAQHSAALAAALDSSVAQLRVQGLELKAELGRITSEQDELRKMMLDGNALSLRVYRDLRADVEARQDAVDRLAAGLHDALSQQQKVAADLASEMELLRTDVQQMEHARDADRVVGDGIVVGMGRLDGAIRELGATYEQDKAVLKALAKDEKQLRSLSRLSMQWLKTETVREVEALLQLRQLLDIGSPMPLLGGWAMDPEAMLALVRFVIEHGPKQIVELGSGTSTLWLAMALRKAGGGKLVSYDHLGQYAAQTSAALHEHGLDAWAEVRVAELQPVEIEGKSYSWYGVDPASLDGAIDMLIVDGPPGSTGPMARFPAVPMLQDSLSEGASIVVDDAGRPDEKKMIAQWQQAHPGLVDAPPLGVRTRLLVFTRSMDAVPTSQANGLAETA